MKIAIVSNFFPPIRTGSSNWAKELAVAHVKAGDDVVVITSSMDNKYESYREDGYTIYRLPSVFRLPRWDIFMKFDQFHILSSPTNYRRIKEILTRHAIEVVHQSNHLLDTPFLTMLACKSLGIPTLNTMAGRIAHAGNPVYDKILKFADKLLLKWMMRRYDVLIALDMVLYEYAEETYEHPWIELILIATQWRDEVRAMPSADPGRPLANNEINIVSVGHVTENRNRLELIRALPCLVERGFKPKLQIAGKELCSLAREEARKLNVEGYVDFLGETPREKLFDMLRQAHIEAHLFAFPGLGCASQEAMASGLPILANVYEELFGDVTLKDREDLMFASPEDQESVNNALLALAEDDSLRGRIGQKAREVIVEHLVWESVIERFREVCHELIEKREKDGVS